MLDKIDVKAWEATGAVHWVFAGRNDHLWDRERHFDRVRSGNREVLLRIDDKTGYATEDGRALEGEELASALEGAWASWVNDSFWLNAPAKCFDPGTERQLVKDDEGTHLLVVYTSGGKTPGDAYMWDVGERLPTAWRMWTHVIPVGGVHTTWDGWVKLDTGAWISTKHKLGPKDLPLDDVRGAATLAELVPGEDPFARLVAN